jgi:hypothetical protein
MPWRGRPSYLATNATAAPGSCANPEQIVSGLNGQRDQNRYDEPAQRDKWTKALSAYNVCNLAEDRQRNQRNDPVQDDENQIKPCLEHLKDLLLPWSAQLSSREA